MKVRRLLVQGGMQPVASYRNGEIHEIHALGAGLDDPFESEEWVIDCGLEFSPCDGIVVSIGGRYPDTEDIINKLTIQQKREHKVFEEFVLTGSCQLVVAEYCCSYYAAQTRFLVVSGR